MARQQAEMEISLRQARRLAIDSSLLGPRPGLGSGTAAIEAAIARLGYIQIDSISVVSRAHHHIAWARLPRYREGQLYSLLEQRRIFEYWGHAASFLPISDYRYYLPLMRAYRQSPPAWLRSSLRKYGSLLPQILHRIASDGPLSSADLGNEHGQRRGQWWDWKPAKMALEILMWQGELMVSARRGFQRLYDLTERVLPDGTDRTEPEPGELAEFLIGRATTAYGMATLKDIRGMIRSSRLAPVAAAVKSMASQGRLVPVSIRELPGQLWYCSAQTAAGLPASARRRPRLRILSPFDNLVIQRERLESLFSFNYRIECYTPRPRRRFGYFCLPILWDEQLVGRLDAKADRSGAILEVRSLHYEDGFQSSSGFRDELARELQRFAVFNCCSVVSLADGGENVSTREVQDLRRGLASG